MFNPTRDESRLFFIDTWRKTIAELPLTDMEQIASLILRQHPEYHAYLTPAAIHQDFHPEQDQVNPFLHFSMHLAIEEQLAINQPAGIRDLFFALQKKVGSEHDALHVLMDGMIEMMWTAQRYNTQPDPEIYLNHARKVLGLPTHPA